MGMPRAGARRHAGAERLPRVPKTRGQGCRCQFCQAVSHSSLWKKSKDACPQCGRRYDAILAQEGDD